MEELNNEYKKSLGDESRDLQDWNSDKKLGVLPYFEGESIRKLSSPRSELKDNIIKYNKSHLWSETIKSDLIYLNL